MEKLNYTVETCINSLHADVKTLITLSTGSRHDVDWIRRNEAAREALLDPIDKYVVQKHRIISEGHFHSHYVEWRTRRISKVLEVYGIDFKGKKILELGGGHGDIGAFFAALGADVISAEFREENVQFSSLKHRNVPNFRSLQCNLEEDFTHLGKFDLIINFGFLEMVKNVDLVVDCSTKMSDDVFLETMCCDSLDDQKIVFGELPPEGIDHPIHGISARPSPAYLERLFAERDFSANRYFNKNLNVMSENPNIP